LGSWDCKVGRLDLGDSISPLEVGNLREKGEAGERLETAWGGKALLGGRLLIELKPDFALSLSTQGFTSVVLIPNGGHAGGG